LDGCQFANGLLFTSYNRRMMKNPSTAAAPSPISSMTGFGAAQSTIAGWQVVAEVKSVNSRYLDLSFKLAEDARAHEALLREAITARVARGKLECKIALKPAGVAAAPQLNEAAVAQFAALHERVRSLVPHLAAPRLSDVLAWPGVSTQQDENTENTPLRDAILAITHQALDALLAARAREGAALAQAITSRIAAIRAIVATLRTRLPQVLAQQQQRITERMEVALGLVAGQKGLNAGSPIGAEEVRERIRQEVIMIGTRIDVAEELDRLDAHCTEVDRLLKAGGAVGKKLDFIVQEFNREANTLGSKMVAEDFQKASIELKVLIEQMREQLQNLE
jgi:uncharacterized protein (TIGR00255 family)